MAVETTHRPVVVVTGAGTGIGAAIAQRFANMHWYVVVNYRQSREAAEDTAAACESAGAQVVLIQADVAEDADCKALADRVMDRWGRIDALVNNAGTTRFCRAEDLEGLSKADFEHVFSVNVIGAFQMIRACVPALKKSNHGAVVNISSHAGFSGIGSSIAYAGSKAALNNLTLALARTLAPQVRVNAVCPGFVDTQWAKGSMDEETYARFKQHIERMTPLQRITTAEEVADSVWYLVNNSVAVTGQLLVVDGGNHLTVNAPKFDP